MSNKTRSVSASQIPLGSSLLGVSSTFFGAEDSSLKPNGKGIENSFDKSFKKSFDQSFDQSYENSFEKSFNNSFENSLESSLHDAQEHLDIVGTFHTLNLDADPSESSPVAHHKRVDSVGNNILDDLTEDGNQVPSVPPQRLVSQNILTPNMSSTSTFGVPNTLANPKVTPSYGWSNNYLPFSAPPMGYPVSDPSITAEKALQIPPFRLPDEGGAGVAKNGQSSLTPNFTQQQQQQQFHNFGGALDSRFVFDHFGRSSPESFNGPPYGRVDGSRAPVRSISGGGGDGAYEKTRVSSGEFNPAVPYQQYMGSNLWNQNQYAPPPHSDHYLANSFGHFGQMNIIPSSPGPISGPMVNPGFDDTYKYGGARLDSAPQFGNNRRNNHMNGGVNIHRKMHNNNRRKGDDANKYVNAKLSDFSGQIYSLCKDQHGCRFLQRQLDSNNSIQGGSGSSEDIAATMIFNELYSKIVELMVDPFGNYLIQKMFECVSPDQRLILVKNAAPEFVRIALDPHGTRALQKLIECISSPDESRLVIESLRSHVVSLSRDLNGNHVVQRCLQRLRPEDNQFIFDAASAHCEQIATHRHGCCVLQRCLDHGSAQQRAQLSLRVAQISTVLSSDPFGNYVVQYVLTRGDEKSIAQILDHISAHVVSLSLHKFGSNVIEKSLRISHLTDAVIDVLLKNQKSFSLLLNDSYGNYVLQTSLDVASPTDLAKLAASLHPYLPSIKNTPHGRRILTKIQNIL